MCHPHQSYHLLWEIYAKIYESNREKGRVPMVLSGIQEQADKPSVKYTYNVIFYDCSKEP